jgi:3-oxoacyl-[acyl-carrier protein] reductase
MHGQDGSALVALITGASRGIGAETARMLSKQTGAQLIVNYREKRRRAEQVVADITGAGGQALAMQADLTNCDEVAKMLAAIAATCGRIDILILNASGGMERGADPGYALRINRDAQLNLIASAADLMPSGSRIVFVTSHQAHFHGRRPTLTAYEPVAQSKRAGEDALRAKIPDLAERGIDVVIVSGDMIEGTTTVMLLDRAYPGALDARRDQAGRVPTIPDFAAAITAAAITQHPTGHTIYVGGRDYLAADQERPL